LVICFSPLVVSGQSPSRLQRALDQDDVAKIRAEIESKPQLLTAPLSTWKISPLDWAIQNGKLEVVQLLLEMDAPLDFNDRQKRSALHSALTRKHEAILELVLAKTENVDVRDRNQLTPLMYATMYQQTKPEVIDKLLAKGADVNAVNSSKQTALHLAGYYGRTECGKRLIDAGADVSALDNGMATPFLAACSTSPELVAHLLRKNADPLVRNAQGQSGLHLASQSGRFEIVNLIIDRFENVDIEDKNYRTPLMAAVYANNAKLAQLLIDRGADPNRFNSRENQSKTGVPPLVNYAAMGGNSELLKALVQAGAQVNVTTKEGDTPLHLAAQAGGIMFGNENARRSAQGYLDSLKTLLDNQANVNLKNDANETPIEVAAKREFLDAVELLAENSKDLNFEIGEGSLIHWAAKNGLPKTVANLVQQESKSVNTLDEFKRTPVHLAAEQGHANVVELLIKSRAEFDRPDIDGSSPLLIASAAGHVEVVERLIDAGADISRLDDSGQSALHLASWNGANEVVSLLLRKLGKSDQKTKSGYTPLHAAAWNGHAKVVAQLLKSGADPNPVDSDGWTPLHKAAYRGHLDAVKVLLANGADKSRMTTAGMAALAMASGSEKTEIIELLK
jgi:cytohesin